MVPWYKNAVFYEIYVRAFQDSNGDGHGDLRGVMQRLDYLRDLGVDCLWLLPISPSPLRDDGYDVADYTGILPEYGTLDDFRALLEAAHGRGLRVITDLVVNHTSDQHPWFQAARRDPTSPYHNYYVWSDSAQKYPGVRVIFQDTETSNWTWDESAKKYFWHRFYSTQPDLNFDNPAVQEEMLKIMRFWLDLGVDGFRVDAVPYLFEREGTNCENLPETHHFLRRMRTLMDEHYPDRILLCEANQWPEEVRPYFGDGDEFHLGFHFPVMPRIYMALRRGERTALVDILNRTPPIPDNCQWCTFLRNHDELTLEMVTEEERQWMWQEYAPEQRMRLNLGIRRRLTPLLDNDKHKLALANSLLFSLPGSPVLYYGDEIGMGDNIHLLDRNGVRTPMQWTGEPGGGFSTASVDLYYVQPVSQPPYQPEIVNVETKRQEKDSIWHIVQVMITLRKTNPVLGLGKFRWVDNSNKTLAAYFRADEEARILVVNNLSALTQQVAISLENEGFQGLEPLLTRGLASDIHFQSDGVLTFALAPYGYCWVRLVSSN